MIPHRPMPVAGGVGGMPMGVGTGMTAGVTSEMGTASDGMHPQVHLQTPGQSHPSHFRPHHGHQPGAAGVTGLNARAGAQGGVYHPHSHQVLAQEQHHVQQGIPPQLQHPSGSGQHGPQIHQLPQMNQHSNPHAQPHASLNGISSPHPSSAGVSTPPNAANQGQPMMIGRVPSAAGAQVPGAVPNHFAPQRRASGQLEHSNADSNGFGQAVPGSAQTQPRGSAHQNAVRLNGSLPDGHSSHTRAVGTLGGPPRGLPIAPAGQVHTPPGSGVMRMLQYSEALAAGPERDTMEYWQDWAKEFYASNGVFHYVLWNPTSREQKAFEVPTSVLPRYMLTNYISGMKGASLHLEAPREYVAGATRFPSSSSPFATNSPAFATKFSLHLEPSSAVTHLVQCDRAIIMQYFSSGWQIQQIGAFRAALVPAPRLVPVQAGSEGPHRYEVRLRLESFDYSCISHTSYLSHGMLSPVKMEQSIPKETIQAILAAHGISDSNAAGEMDSKGGMGVKTSKKPMRKQSSAASKKEEKDRGKAEGAGATAALVKEEDKDSNGTKNENRDDETTSGAPGNNSFFVSVEKLDLPESPVNEYGITLRAMRCLEITESVCHLRALMDFTQHENIGPLEGLRKLAQQFREQQRMSSAGGSAGSNYALLPAAAINATASSHPDPTASGEADAAAGMGGQIADNAANKRKGAPGEAAGGNANAGRLNLSRSSTQQGSNASPKQVSSPTKRQR
ncbi:hypothetical protein IE81DRAFT_368579 [Ceraceosorus guamensis]|uniref:Uncharacterized protein n=1 Tax=Ceraceosorus guamensis TaxID=1522189 RepID=A0A316VQY3_9BASI|nr:hypothetical protein IE81DRAFT_368579 [Ceraceosorus guamensis]PWN40069.1 hypothetical protein IE81DRAFT_368579 [Ceraceosorus guamensis]